MSSQSGDDDESDTTDSDSDDDDDDDDDILASGATGDYIERLKPIRKLKIGDAIVQQPSTRDNDDDDDDDDVIDDEQEELGKVSSNSALIASCAPVHVF